MVKKDTFALKKTMGQDSNVISDDAKVWIYPACQEILRARN